MREACSDRRNMAVCSNEAHLKDNARTHTQIEHRQRHKCQATASYAYRGIGRPPQRGLHRCSTQHCSIATERLAHAQSTSLPRRSLFLRREVHKSQPGLALPSQHNRHPSPLLIRKTVNVFWQSRAHLPRPKLYSSVFFPQAFSGAPKAPSAPEH